MQKNKSSSSNQPGRRYEEYAYVLDYKSRAKSLTVKGREGILITAVGGGRLVLLEILAIPDSSFEVSEKIYIGKNDRTKILSVLGKLEYRQISNSAQSELGTVIEFLVEDNESKFVDHLNKAQAITPRIHALELIPGIGKTYMKAMLDERSKNPFQSYDDLQQRVGFKEPAKQIAKRVVEEITGNTRMNIFVKR